MAERIVSPGVFTRERDVSFLPQGIGEIGAAIVGPTVKGPAFVPTTLTSFSEFENTFGGLDTRFYVPYTVQEYFDNGAPAVTIVRVLGIGGYQSDSLYISISSSTQNSVAAVLKPSRKSPSLDIESGGQAVINDSQRTWSEFMFTVNSVAYTASFDTGSDSYLTKVFSSDPQDTNKDLYVYKNFETYQCEKGFSSTVGSASLASGSGEDFTHDYSVATTPYIISQEIGGSRKNLFKVNTRSHGTDINDKYKLGIADLRAKEDIAGSDFGDFTLRLLKNNPGENDDGQLVEEFTNLNFDPDSVNYIPRQIGDRYVTIDSNGKLTYNGDWPNKSPHIYISDYETELEGISGDALPHGFAAVTNPVLQTTSVPSASFQTNQYTDHITTGSGRFDTNEYYGWDFNSQDNKNYLAPLPASAGTGNNVVFTLENMVGTVDASEIGADTYSDGTEAITMTLSAKEQRKFAVPFQGGFDGDDPTTLKATGTDISTTNQQGFNCTNANASGTVAYKRAINAVSNPDEFDMNMLVTPGIIHEYHTQVTNHAISKVEDRADTFYVMDGSRWGRSVTNAVGDIKSIDTNYAATYYPWVKILDPVKNKPIWVPPSVVIPGVIANTDSVAHEWFAPAGLNRGGLTSVLEAKTRLTHKERDTLYEGRVNPIASFPQQGVVVFGQKTLQGKPSALDRINVRRLLIALRKFIASSSRFLVFEQNTAATRNRFLGIVNPYLNSVQANSGLSAFRVVMDDSNNTPDVVDRNELRGQIFIQPTRTAEFIVLDFIVQPTGATFPE
jgi:phage tail sheath protein FI